MLPDIAPAAPLETVDERLRLYDAVVGWLRRASAERPILLVLDDWQWADDDSRLLLAYVARWVQSLPVLVLLTEAGTVGAAELAAPPEGAEVVELGGLDEGAVDVILGDIAERPLSQPAVTAIHQVSAGHPLFVRELYLHARESGLLIGGGELVAADLPATYEAVIAWRLSRLPLDTRTVLNAIACFPHGVGAGLLTEVTGMARARLIDVVERGVSAGLVRPAEQGQRYTLYHDRLRLTLAAGVPARVRAAVHRRAEEAREAELGEDARGHAAELVDHLVAVWNVEPPGGTDSRAVRHLLVAAEQARAAYAHRRAATLLGYAVKAFGEGRQTDYVDLTARHALANAEAGLTDPAVAGVRELVTGQRRHGPLVRETWSDIVATIRTLRYGGDVATAAALARTAADEGAPRDELVRHRLRLLAEEWHTTEPGGIPTFAWRTDDSPAADALVARGDEADRADAFLYQRPRGPAESGRLTVAVADWHRPASALRGLRAASSDLALRVGQFGAGATMAGRYLVAAERFGSLTDLGSALLLLSRSRAALGELAPAADILHASDQVIARVGDAGWLVPERLLAELASAHYLDADWPSLTEQINASLQAGVTPFGVELESELALAYTRAENETKARETVGRLLQAAGQVPPLTFGRDAALFNTLTAIWELGAAEHATTARQLLEKTIAAGAGGSHTSTPQLALARMHGLIGNLALARDEFDKERGRLDGAGMRPLRAILDHDEAVAIAAGGSGFAEAGMLLAHAIRQFDDLGMQGWAERSRALIAQGFEEAARPGGRLYFSYPAGLSRREVDVVRLMAAGSTSRRSRPRPGHRRTRPGSSLDCRPRKAWCCPSRRVAALRAPAWPGWRLAVFVCR